jgi:hypothetical protein
MAWQSLNPRLRPVRCAKQSQSAEPSGLWETLSTREEESYEHVPCRPVTAFWHG